MALFGFGKGKSASSKGGSSSGGKGGSASGGKKPARTTGVVQSGKEEKKKSAPPGAVSSASSTLGVNNADLSHVLRNPRITEKATAHSASGVYTFDVSDSATKRSISQAIISLYNVKPRGVRIVPVPAKVRRSARTGKYGISRGGKKAYVYLKKGETITIT